MVESSGRDINLGIEGRNVMPDIEGVPQQKILDYIIEMNENQEDI